MKVLVTKTDHLICLKHGKLVKTDINFKIIKTGASIFPKLVMRFSLLSRFLRYQIYAQTFISKDEILISIKGRLCLIDINNLSYTILKTPAGFKKSLDLNIVSISGRRFIIYSNYSLNKSFNNIDIFVAPLTDLNDFKLFKTFENKKINHIHSYAQDSSSEDIYANVGDVGESVGVWKINSKLADPVPWLTGSQKYRAVLSYWKDDLFWLINDNPHGKNKILLFRKDKSGKPFFLESLSIDGPCIYGTYLNSKIFFSTSCEPRNNGFTKDYFPISYSSDRCILYSLDLKNKTLNRIANAKKDIFSSILFGFGTFRFPLFDSDLDTLYFYSNALEKRLDSNYIVKCYSNCYSLR